MILQIGNVTKSDHSLIGCHQCALIRRAGPQRSTEAVEEGTQRNVWKINTCHRASSCFPLPPGTETALKTQRSDKHTHSQTEPCTCRANAFWCDQIKCDTTIDETSCCLSASFMFTVLLNTCQKWLPYQSSTLSRILRSKTLWNARSDLITVHSSSSNPNLIKPKWCTVKRTAEAASAVYLAIALFVFSNYTDV